MLVRKLEEKKEDLKILNSPKFIKIIEKRSIMRSEDILFRRSLVPDINDKDFINMMLDEAVCNGQINNSIDYIEYKNYIEDVIFNFYDKGD